MTPVVYAADIGSIAGGNFGWARIDGSAGTATVERGGGSEVTEMVNAIADDLTARRHPVALGLECPLLVPVPPDPQLLGKARLGDGNRSWSAGPGAAVLATGLAQTAWILAELRTRCPDSSAYLDWEAFTKAGDGLFIWEAFVTGPAKTTTHADDAFIAAQTFAESLPDPPAMNGVIADRPMSLVGAALLWSGWASDPAILHTPCVVLKAEPDPDRTTPQLNDDKSRPQRKPSFQRRSTSSRASSPMRVRVADLAQQIPEGSWTTYGDVATYLGSSAMAIAAVLANIDIPNAHRILNAKGEIAAGFAFPDGRTDDPRTLLESEGILFRGDRAEPAQRWPPR